MEELIKKIEALRDNFNSRYALEENAYTKACEDILELIEQLRQYNVEQSEQLICPCCGSDKTYKTDAIHCNRCAVTTEI